MVKRIVQFVRDVVKITLRKIWRGLKNMWKKQSLGIKVLATSIAGSALYYLLFLLGSVALAIAPVVSVGAFLAAVFLTAWMIDKLIKNIGRILAAAKNILKRIAQRIKNILNFFFDVLTEIFFDVWTFVKLALISVITTPYWVLMMFVPATAVGTIILWSLINLNLILMLGFYLWFLGSKYGLVTRLQERRKHVTLKSSMVSFERFPEGVL